MNTSSKQKPNIAEAFTFTNSILPCTHYHNAPYLAQIVLRVFCYCKQILQLLSESGLVARCVGGVQV